MPFIGCRAFMRSLTATERQRPGFFAVGSVTELFAPIVYVGLPLPVGFFLTGRWSLAGQNVREHLMRYAFAEMPCALVLIERELDGGGGILLCGVRILLVELARRVYQSQHRPVVALLQPEIDRR